MTSSMEYDCLKPNQVPHLTQLYSTYLASFKKLSAFYGNSPDLRGIRRAIRQLTTGRAAYAPETRRVVAKILREENSRFAAANLAPAVERNLSLFENGAVAIVTGQQPVLFGGPAYCLYKAMSAVRIAQGLRRDGVNAVPVFWVASQDHDLAETNHVAWQTSNGIERIEWRGGESFRGRSVGAIPLGESINPLVHHAQEAFSGPEAKKMCAILSAAYGPGETFASAFAKMMAVLFGESGLILVDPLDAPLQRLAPALLSRSKKLEAAGYHVQVKVTERSTQMFGTVQSERVAIHRRNSGFALGPREYSRNELNAEISAHPGDFSGNALLRPIVQDTLLPTAAYVAGPAEIAYFAQNRVLYDHLLGRMPAILPRASFTLIEPSVTQLLKRYGLAAEEVFRGRQRLRTRMELQRVPRDLAGRFASDKKKLECLLAALERPLAKLDPTLTGALATAKEKMLYQFAHLEGKAGRAVDFRTGVLARHEQTIADALYPQNDLQERSLSLLPFLARHGTELLDNLGKHCGLKQAAHCLVRL
jgi:bacillithiol synthase